MSAQPFEGYSKDVRIFISHSNADNAFGTRLAEDLRRVLGDPAAVWYDSLGGLHPGVAWWQTIIKEVAERPIFLVIWSPDARDSQWVNDEVDQAWQEKNTPGGKTIIPLIWQPCDLRGDLRTRQAISFTNLDEYDQHFAELLTGLGIATRPIEPLPVSEAETQQDVSHDATTVVAPPGELNGATDATTTGGWRNELLLFSIEGYWPPRREAIHGPVVTIGRQSGNDVLLADPAVSRFHIRLVRQRAGWRAEKLPNARPMYVNGEQREMAMLGHGDQIVIGGTVLRVEQPATFVNVSTIISIDARSVLASGFMPDLVVETHQFHFTAPLRSAVVTVGRAEESTLVIPSPIIAAHQVVIRRMPTGSFELESVREAPNRFALGGRSIKQHVLRSGDVLTLGSRALNQFVSLTYLAAGANLA